LSVCCKPTEKVAGRELMDRSPRIFFKLGSLMQEHRLRENEFIHDLIKVKKIREDLESHINVISLFSLKS
jgi:hypothetical protein